MPHSEAMGSRVPPMTHAPPPPCVPMHNPSIPSWLFDNRMLTIAHEANACELCSSWVHHYVKGIIQHDVSLSCAEATWKTHFQADLVAQWTLLTQNNEVLHNKVTAMRDSLEIAQQEN